MLQAGNTWRKLSGAYRFDKDPEMSGVNSVAREVLKVAGDKVKSASDWPHTRFERLDVRPLLNGAWSGVMRLD